MTTPSDNHRIDIPAIGRCCLTSVQSQRTSSGCCIATELNDAKTEPSKGGPVRLQVLENSARHINTVQGPTHSRKITGADRNLGTAQWPLHVLI